MPPLLPDPVRLPLSPSLCLSSNLKLPPPPSHSCLSGGCSDALVGTEHVQINKPSRSFPSSRGKTGASTNNLKQKSCIRRDREVSTRGSSEEGGIRSGWGKSGQALWERWHHTAGFGAGRVGHSKWRGKGYESPGAVQGKAGSG